MSNKRKARFGDIEIYIYDNQQMTVIWIYIKANKSQNEIDFFTSNKKFKILAFDIYNGDWGYLPYLGAKNLE